MSLLREFQKKWIGNVGPPTRIMVIMGETADERNPGYHNHVILVPS